MQKTFNILLVIISFQFYNSVFYENYRDIVKANEFYSNLNNNININIRVVPADSKIYFDGKLQESGLINTTLGKHRLTIQKEGYQTAENYINVDKNSTEFEFVLIQVDLIETQITSVPDGAQIFIDGLLKGITNKKLFLFPGSYSLRLIKQGYIDKEEKLLINKNSNNFIFNLEKYSGILNLITVPNSAKININKEQISQNYLEIPPGIYKIEVSDSGYYDYSEIIEIELGKTITKRVELLPKVGNLQFSISPLESAIKLTKNGQLVDSWDGMKILKNLKTGDYEINAEAKGFISETRKIKIIEKQTTQLEINLKKDTINATITINYINSSIIEQNLIFVEGGTFMMGNKNGQDDEIPLHTVSLNSFFISKYEITQKEWCEIMKLNPSSFINDNLPVESVSWENVQEYIKLLNKITNKKYRLPTEAEWEYAAKGGKNEMKYPFAGGYNVNEVAWYYGNSEKMTHSIGTKKSNNIGLFDMSGNVKEWCQDNYKDDFYKVSSQNNPIGPTYGIYKVIRGGSWNCFGDNCRISDRDYEKYDKISNEIGFRLVLDAE